MTNEEVKQYEKYIPDAIGGAIRIGVEQFEDLLNETINSIQENTKLKAENEASEMARNKQNDILLQEIKRLEAELEQSIKLPCEVGDKFYCVAYDENPRVIKVFCDGYGILKNNSMEPEQKFLWMANVDRPSDYWKINFSIFNEKMFLTREEAEQSLKGENNESKSE